MEEVIKDEDKALILLSSLSGEAYEIFVLTLINDKKSLSYNEVSAALVNHDLGKKDKQSSNNTSTEALVAGEISSNHRKGKGGIDKTKNHQLGKSQCAFCKEEGS